MAAVTAAGAGEGDVPLLVRVLAGNPVTSAHILACLTTAEARHLRRLHRTVPAAVAGVPWCDTDMPVVDAARWRTCFPAAVGVWLTDRAVGGLLVSEPAVAALGGVNVLVLLCTDATDDLLLRLPTSLHTLNVRSCRKLTGDASFAHLTALTSLYCSGTKVVSTRTDGLPPSLRVLDITSVHELRYGASLAHLRQLRVLRAERSGLGDITLASLPPSLEELHAAHCEILTPVASFAHLAALRKLNIALSAVGDATLATLPPSLVSLNLREGKRLTRGAALPRLPSLQLLDVSYTGIGDALVASLPASVVEVWLNGCVGVTAGTTLDHLRALRVLNCVGITLAPAALAGCRERGCVVVAGGLGGHACGVSSLALLPGGRLASGDWNCTVRLWDATRGGEAAAALEGHGGWVCALTMLSDGRRMAASGWADRGKAGEIMVWDTGVVPYTRCATISCGSGVYALAALHDGRLAAGCIGRDVRLIDVGARAGAVVATLKGHTESVAALAVLPNGTLASGSHDTTVRLWEVGTGACVATLAGHQDWIRALAVLADGRLASGSDDKSVRLWDVATRVCVGVLEGHTSYVHSLAALIDGRLASGSRDCTIRVWDTRPVAAGAAAAAAPGATPVVVLKGHTGYVFALQALPGGRLASGSEDKSVRLWSLLPV